MADPVTAGPENAPEVTSVAMSTAPISAPSTIASTTTSPTVLSGPSSSALPRATALSVPGALSGVTEGSHKVPSWRGKKFGTGKTFGGSKLGTGGGVGLFGSAGKKRPRSEEGERCLKEEEGKISRPRNDDVEKEGDLSEKESESYRNGEEGEKTVFQTRARLFCREEDGEEGDSKTSEQPLWDESGAGPLRVNEFPGGGGRIILRQEGTAGGSGIRVLLNLRVCDAVRIRPVKEEGKLLSVVTLGGMADGPPTAMERVQNGKVARLLIRFARQIERDECLQAIENLEKTP